MESSDSYPKNKDKVMRVGVIIHHVLLLQIKQNCKLFLGGLHLETTEEDLREFFQEFGDIVDCVVMRDGGSTRRSRGFGFVTFAEPSSVDKALDSKPHVITGREVDSKRAVPKEDCNPMAHVKTKRLFVGGLGPGIGEEELKKYFEKEFGTVIGVEVPRDKSTDRGRGFAFVDLEDYDKVDKACIQRYHEIRGRNCEVKKAETKEAIRVKESLAQEKAAAVAAAAVAYGSNDMRSLRGPGPTDIYDSPYGASFYGAAGKSYFGRGYPPMTFSPFMSPAGAAGPYSPSIYDAGGYIRDSFGRAMSSPQRRMDPYSSVGVSPYGSGGSPYSAAGASYYGSLERDKLMGSYFGAGYSQLPSSFGPSRDYSRERDGSSADSRDRKHPVAGYSSSTRSYHPYH